jgi:hypothetical protein
LRVKSYVLYINYRTFTILNKIAMKKLLFIILVVSLFSCEKDKTKPTYTPNGYKAGDIEIWVNSNYRYPKGFAEIVNKDTSFYCFKTNVSSLTDSCLIYKKVPNAIAGDYTIEFAGSLNGSKNPSDSLKYMKDSNKIWINVKIAVGGKVIYDKTNGENSSTYSGGTFLYTTCYNTHRFTLY